MEQSRPVSEIVPNQKEANFDILVVDDEPAIIELLVYN